MQTQRRLHRGFSLIFAVAGLASACKGDIDTSNCPDDRCADAGTHGASGSSGAKSPSTQANDSTGGVTGSGGNHASAGSGGSGGMSSASGGSGGADAGGGSKGKPPPTSDAGGVDAAVAVDGGPPLADYTLVVDAPSDGMSVSDTVTVSGRAPGFKNVEVWDSMHMMPPLAQGAPDADGNFEFTIDASTLASGTTTWTVHAWDSPPGQSFSNTASATIGLTITSANAPTTGSCDNQTCSGHGTCSVTGGNASCACGSGFHAVGLECIADTSGNDGAADPGTTYVPSGYSLVFNDEFTNNTLDTNKWTTLGPWGVQFFADSKQKQAFVPKAVSSKNGILTFTADHANGASEAKGQPYTSGSITTNQTFTHGYFEARVKVPAGKGFWPAYWLTSSDRWPPEWDIFEIINNVIYGYPHPIQSGKCQFVEGAAGGDSTYSISNLYGVYHVYGFKWTASDIYWYVDGTLTEHYAIDAAAGANDPYWLNISFQLGGDWPGDPDSSTPLPAHMDVDYMRVYQPN